MLNDPRGEDRLPWLEPVDDYADEDPISIARLVGSVVLGLVLLGVVIGGIFWFRHHRSGDGNGALIAAPAGPVKERPGDAGGMDVEGTGDVAYGASVGEEINSVIDPRRAPETPITEAQPAAARPATDAAEGQAAPDKAASAPAAKPVPQPVKGRGAVTVDLGDTGAGSSSNLLQLGSFSSTALAKQAWTKMTARFPALAQGSYQVVPATVGDKTFYRLRARIGGGGAATCARIKAAGEACSVLD